MTGRRLFGWIGPSACLLVLALTPSSASSGTELATAVLAGAQESPPTASTGMGLALLTFDPGSLELCWAISFTGLSAAETGAHIHGAGPGVNGPVLIQLALANPKNDCATITPEQRRMFRHGQLYINIHTTAFPAGEIRGQILPHKHVHP